jgi:hypothetical protein
MADAKESLESVTVLVQAFKAGALPASRDQWFAQREQWSGKNFALHRPPGNDTQTEIMLSSFPVAKQSIASISPPHMSAIFTDDYIPPGRSRSAVNESEYCICDAYCNSRSLTACHSPIYAP